MPISFGMLTDLTGFGAAGLMGAMWLWERRLSRTREEQITQSHEQIRRDEQRIGLLTDVVERNTAAFSRFSETQKQFERTLAEFAREIRHANRAK